VALVFDKEFVMISMRRLIVIGMVCCGGWGATRATAEQLPSPTIRAYAGAFLAGDDHSFFVDSEVRAPLLRLGPVTGSYRYRESTPFLQLDAGAEQAEVLFVRQELQAELRLGAHARLVGLSGYHTAHLVDRAGLSSAYVFGGGVAGPTPSPEQRLDWHVLAGTYVDRRELRSDWWSELRLSWRAYDFLQNRYRDGEYRGSLALGAEMESSNDGGRLRALYRIGPEVQFVTAHGNQASIQLQWFRNDDHPFFGLDENGVLLGLNVTSSRDESYVFHGLETRQSGLLPMVWGAYDVGIGASRRIIRFQITAEVVDFTVADHLVSLVVWYETRQEHRIGDFDNIAYSVALGLQAPVGLHSPLSQGKPLVAGFDFVHRSDHALNPNAARVREVGRPTAGPDIGEVVGSGGLNLLPRLRLQTVGWDLPYRDPSMYERRTAWLHWFDWRVTAGYDLSSDRNRGRLAGQIGLNWDIATLQGQVVYLLAIGSLGNETPDWLAELGVRRPIGRVFVRYERYGMHNHLARGDTLVAGFGLNL
jgi:hypothetical protein